MPLEVYNPRADPIIQLDLLQAKVEEVIALVLGAQAVQAAAQQGQELTAEQAAAAVEQATAARNPAVQQAAAEILQAAAGNPTVVNS